MDETCKKCCQKYQALLNYLDLLIISNDSYNNSNYFRSMDGPKKLNKLFDDINDDNIRLYLEDNTPKNIDTILKEVEYYFTLLNNKDKNNISILDTFDKHTKIMQCFNNENDISKLKNSDSIRTLIELLPRFPEPISLIEDVAYKVSNNTRKM